MSKKNRDFKKKDTNLGIKVGDWFEDISGSKHGFKYFYMVKSLNQTSVRLVKIGIDDGVLSEVYCVDYDIRNFEKVKNILEADYYELELKKIGGDEARNRLKKIEGVSLILECFGVDKKKVSSQNPSSIQSTTPENKPKEEEDLGIKVGDWLKGTRYSTCCSLDLKSIFFVSKIETDSIFLENASPRNIRFDQSIESEPWNKANFYREEGKVYFKSEDLFIEFEKISKDEVLDTLRSWSTTIDWTFKRLMLIPNPNKKLMTIENFLERGKDFSGKCIIVKPISGRVATCIKVNRVKRGDEVYMNVSHSSIVFYPEIAFDIPIDSKNSCHCRTEKDYPAEKELLYDTHTLIDVISEEEFMALREEFNKARFGEGFKKQEKPIKIYTKEELKSSILKYTSPDGSIYYLEHPEIPEVGIENKPGKFKYCVVSYGIMISNGGQVHFYTPKTNPFNPIVLLIESESDEGFFSRVEEIPDYEWASLKEFYLDEIVKI